MAVQLFGFDRFKAIFDLLQSGLDRVQCMENQNVSFFRIDAHGAGIAADFSRDPVIALLVDLHFSPNEIFQLFEQ